MDFLNTIPITAQLYKNNDYRGLFVLRVGDHPKGHHVHRTTLRFEGWSYVVLPANLLLA